MFAIPVSSNLDNRLVSITCFPYKWCSVILISWLHFYLAGVEQQLTTDLCSFHAAHESGVYPNLSFRSSFTPVRLSNILIAGSIPRYDIIVRGLAPREKLHTLFRVYSGILNTASSAGPPITTSRGPRQILMLRDLRSLRNRFLERICVSCSLTVFRVASPGILGYFINSSPCIDILVRGRGDAVSMEILLTTSSRCLCGAATNFTCTVRTARCQPIIK